MTMAARYYFCPSNACQTGHGTLFYPPPGDVNDCSIMSLIITVSATDVDYNYINYANNSIKMSVILTKYTIH